MSIFASILRMAYKLSGVKKAFALPEDALRKEIVKQNRHRGVFTPTDRKAYYETITVNGFACMICCTEEAETAFLYSARKACPLLGISLCALRPYRGRSDRALLV